MRRFDERLVERLPVRGQLRRIARRGFSGSLRKARIDMQPIVLAGLGFERTRSIESTSRRRRLIEFGVRNRQPHVSHRETWIHPQRLIEGARGFDPQVAVQVRQALVVVRLRVLGRCGDRVVSATDIGAKRQRPVQEFSGNDRNRMRVRDRLGGKCDLAGIKPRECPKADA